MSIKYLGDNQLNQIQNDPNDTPWAKLIAQSEMLERSKMRQPQGRYPQGTVASDIQQQLLNDQMQQANRLQGLDAEKAMMLARLINSGQLQGMADGGLTPSLQNPQQAPMLGVSPINPAKPQVPQTRLAPTKEAADQQPKHDIFQRLLDQSIVGVFNGKANINDTLQLYADMWTGKALKGLADGGEVRRFTEGGTLFEQLQRLKTQMAGAGQGWTPEAVAGYKSAYNPDLVAEMRRRGLNPSGQPLGMSDIMNRPPVNTQSAPQTIAPQPSFRADVAPRPHIGGAVPPEVITKMHPELVGPRKGAAMMSPEAQAYLRDPTSIKATPISEFVGPQIGRLLNGMHIGATVVPDSHTVQQLALPAVANYEFKHPEIKEGAQSLFGIGNTPLWGARKQAEQPISTPTEQPAVAPADQPTTAPTTQAKAVTKQAVTRDNAKQIAAVHGYVKQEGEVLNKAQQLGALAQTESAVTQTAGDNIVDMLHKRLKDADVDYMELAKRISENEKDLAQERKDGTLTAVLTGVGAALSRAGTLEQKGDRVFTPGIGQILGAGILGGIESSEATDKKYRAGIEKNLEALNALQGLKRATANDLMDAYSAERQNAVMAQHYKSIEDIAQQNLPFEQAYMEAQTEASLAQAQENRANAALRNTMAQGTSGGKPLTQANILTASRMAFDQARKMLTADPNFGLKPQNEQLDAINALAQILLANQIGNATGDAVKVIPLPAAQELPGFTKLSSRPAK